MKVPIAAACIALVLLALSASSQQPAAKGSIEGAVTRAGTGEPIPGALVTLGVPPVTSLAQMNTALGTTGLSVVADSQGKFVFKDLVPGAYRIKVGANGYARQEYGQKTFAG